MLFQYKTEESFCSVTFLWARRLLKSQTAHVDRALPASRIHKWIVFSSIIGNLEQGKQSYLRGL
jgi:hypothetical protein